MNIIPDKEANESYQQTRCFLISKKLMAKGHLIQRYRADFLISYNANGVQYNRWVSGNGLDRSLTKNESEQEDILSQFEVGGTYTCWFNPDSPHQVMLLPRHDWYSIFPLLVPAVVSIITLYYFLKTLFKAVDGIMMRSRKKRER
jgi:hypothetical protein